MRFGLRTRVVAAVVLVTTTATAIMTYSAYQLQVNESLGRFASSAATTFEADFKRLTPVMQSSEAGWLDHATRLMLLQDADWAVVSMKPNGPLATVRSVTNPPPVSLAQFVISDSDRLQMLTGYKADLFRPEAGPAMLSVVYTKVPSTGRQVFVITAGFDTPGYYLTETYDLGPLSNDLTALRWKLVYIALGVAVLGVIAALFAARRVQRPVLQVAAAAEHLGAGDLDVRVPVKGRDEVADLARSFNAMAQRLGESMDQQRRFVADVAHDLRTPLASMVAVVDSLDNATPATRTRATEILGTQARRLARLVEDLLEIAQFDAGKADLRMETVDLRALVADAADVSDVDDLEITGDATVVADPRRIHTVVSNLLTNAVRHGAAPITAGITGTESTVTLEVRDSGPGVPEDLLAILFDRFVRGDRARQASAGSGLGLSIARENTLAHGGTLIAHNDSGAVFTLTLPRQPQVSMRGK